MMKKNIGISDRLIRFVSMDLLLGSSLVGVELSSIYANLAFALCIYLTLTMLIAYSPIYHLLGRTTMEEKHNNNLNSDANSSLV